MSFKQNLKAKLELDADPSKRNIQQEVELESEKAYLQLSADKLATKTALLHAKSELERERVKLRYNPGSIIELKSKVDKLEKGLAALEALETEDFPQTNA
jgi:hypothetical protein